MSTKFEQAVAEFYEDADEELLNWKTPWGKFRDLPEAHRVFCYCIYVELASFARRQKLKGLENMRRLMKAVPEGMHFEDVFPTDEAADAFLKSNKN
jgi:hypothetical protein